MVDSLRQQILKAIESGMWSPGTKLPSTREMSVQLGVDPRLVGQAYKRLAGEGLVELRPRSGAYIAVAAGHSAGTPIVPSESWLVDVLAEAVSREIPARELADWLRRSTETLRLRAFVIAPTADQVFGLRRELERYYGLETEGATVESLPTSGGLPLQLRQADIVITTEASSEFATARSNEVGVPCLCVSVRLDLVGPAWRRLMQSPSYVVVTDERFGRVIADFLSDVPGAQNVRMLVVGRDDLQQIPDDAVVYVTQSARHQLSDISINGSVLPTVRVLSRQSSSELLSYIARANLAAMRAQRGTAPLSQDAQRHEPVATADLGK